MPAVDSIGNKLKVDDIVSFLDMSPAEGVVYEIFEVGVNDLVGVLVKGIDGSLYRFDNPEIYVTLEERRKREVLVEKIDKLIK